MFEQLPESRPARERSLTQMALSAGAHALLIAAAVAATQAAAAATAATGTVMPAFLPPPRVEPVRRPPPATRSAAPVAQGFQSLPVVGAVPIAIPVPDLDGVFDPKDYGGLGAIGGRIDGIVGAPTGVAEAITAPTYQSSDVDDPVVMLRGATPRYPAAMRMLGIGGSVTLEFVVGADGRADSTTLRVTASSDVRFEDAARTVILTSTYRAARFRGEPVRQLVRQSVTFTMEP